MNIKDIGGRVSRETGPIGYIDCRYGYGERDRYKEIKC